MITNFLDLPDFEMLLFMLNSSGVLTPMIEFPDGYKTKTYYFKKLEQVKITEINYQAVILSGEISPNPIEDIKTLTESVSEMNSSSPQKTNTNFILFLYFNLETIELFSYKRSFQRVYR